MGVKNRKPNVRCAPADAVIAVECDACRATLDLLALPGERDDWPVVVAGSFESRERAQSSSAIRRVADARAVSDMGVAPVVDPDGKTVDIQPITMGTGDHRAVWRCRCGRSYPATESRLRKAWWSAFNARRSRIVAGRDL